MLDLSALPKAEVHRHLEGCIRPETVWELERELGHIPAGLGLAAFRERLVIREPVPLLEALERFDEFRRPLRGRAAVLRICREALADARFENIRWLELRVSPVTLAAATGISMPEVLAAVREAAAEARADFECLRFACVVSRRRGVEAAWETVRVLEQDAARTFAAVDLASDELRHASSEFAGVARALADLGFGLTVHTGEGVPASFVARALELPGIERLGHALSLADDSGLVAEVAARGLLVEVCPTSNQRVGLVPDLRRHPAIALREAGVEVAICTDDPSLFGVDLAHELGLARAEMGFDDEALALCQDRARRVLQR
jgi:adenosine deaminase